MSIAQNLRQMRQSRGMTQAQVAEKLNIARQTLSSYESGRTLPDIEMLTRLCQVYDTDLDGLIYGRSRPLRAARTARAAAGGIFAALAALTFLSSALLWSANRFFPLKEGVAAPEGEAIIAAHLRLTQAWESVDGVILTVSLLGFFALLLLLRRGPCPISFKQELCYMAGLTAALLLLPLPFALTDPVFAPVNYFFTPAHVFFRMAVFFAVNQAVKWAQRRRRP